MLVTIASSDFQTVLGRLNSIVDKRSSRPVLSNILIYSDDNKLTFVSTNMEVSAKFTIPAKVETSGKICVNAKNIFEISRELPDKDLTINFQKNTLIVQCEKIQYTLLVSDPNEYPQLEFINKSNLLEVSSFELSELINKTSYAISEDDTRLFLNGTYLQLINSKVRAVATDGYKLALFNTNIKINKDTILEKGIIIPKKGIFELKKITESYPDSIINMSFDDSFLFVNVRNSYYLAIRLIARDYPNYQSIIPSKTAHKMIVDNVTFLNSVKRIKVMSDEKSHTVKLKISSTLLEITAINPIMGEAIENIPIKYDGDPIIIGLNAKFLINTLSVLNDGIVTFNINNELSPLVVKSDVDLNFLGIIMPIKLNF